ncbi:MAG: hypothetical protein ACI83O_000946 [Patescibacteria group bacterium]|jgi:hypothetical protein
MKSGLVTQEEKAHILKEVKGLLSTFGSKLAEVESEESHFVSSVSSNGQREEGSPWKTDEAFSDLQFLNAPFVEDRHIVAEKAAWKK